MICQFVINATEAFYQFRKICIHPVLTATQFLFFVTASYNFAVAIVQSLMGP